MLEPISKKKLVWASPDIKLEEISTLKNMTTLKSSWRPVNVTTNTFSMYFAIIELELVVSTGTNPTFKWSLFSRYKQILMT